MGWVVVSSGVGGIPSERYRRHRRRGRKGQALVWGRWPRWTDREVSAVAVLWTYREQTIYGVSPEGMLVRRGEPKP